MAQVKFKSIALLTGGIFVMIFFHHVPVGPTMTNLGDGTEGAATQIIEENTGIAKVTKQAGFESELKHENGKSVFGESFGSRPHLVSAQTSYLKN